MKPIEIAIKNWFGGVIDDVRQNSSNSFNICKHFDIFTNPFRLTPYRQFIADQTASSTDDMKQYFIRDFTYSSSSAKLYGLGQTGAGLTKIAFKADATTGNWTLPASSEGDDTVRNGCLVEYKDFLWGFQGTAKVFKWGLLSGTPSITNSAGNVGTVYNTVTAVTITAGGTLYNINDILTVTAGNNSCRLIVTAVSGGAVTAVSILEPGSNQTTGSGKATTVVPSGGTGCTINITTVGNVTTGITSVAQGLIAKDDNLYLPYNNILARVYPSGTVQDQALKLPATLKITSITNYNNYLAIGCSPINSFNGVSKVFIWNLTSPDIQEVIDWGEGELRVLENIDGMIVGVTDRYLNNETGAGRGSMVIQGFTGGYPQVLKEVFTSKLTGISIPLAKTVKNNRVFFTAKILTNDTGTEYNEGIWSFGRKNASYPYALSLDYIDENVSTSGIQSFGSAGNFFYIAHSADGSIDKIDDTADYSFSSIYETQTFNFGDVDLEKRLDKIKVSFRKLKSGESLTVKYKVDTATTWTTIGTFNTVGAISKTFLREETGNKDFATGKEYEFRIESTGGLEITGLRLQATPLSTI